MRCYEVKVQVDIEAKANAITKGISIPIPLPCMTRLHTNVLRTLRRSFALDDVASNTDINQ